MAHADMIIETKQLCKSYTVGTEIVPVLQNIELSLARGEYVSMMGQSGAGKSTFLNILGCLDTPDSGTYLLNGHEVASLSHVQLADVRNRDIGFVFQNFNLLPRLSIEANVELPLVYAGVGRKERRERVGALLERFGIYERRHHRPNQISGGQKQRVAIARALVKNPALVLADEPTGNLDSHTTLEILRVFDEIASEGNSILLITHEHDVAERAHRIIHIADGRIVS